MAKGVKAFELATVTTVIKQLDYELEISIYSIDEGAARVNYHVIEIGSA